MVSEGLRATLVGKARCWLLVLVGHEVEQLLILIDQKKAES